MEGCEMILAESQFFFIEAIARFVRRKIRQVSCPLEAIETGCVMWIEALSDHPVWPFMPGIVFGWRQ